MAHVQFSDIVERTEFAQYVQEKATDNDRLLKSSIVTMDSELSKKLNAGGASFHMPHWNPISRGGWEIPDDTTDEIVSTKIDAQDMKVHRIAFAKSFESADFTASLAGSDPMEAMTKQIADDMNIQKQATLISILRGITADNIVNHNSDMVIDISTQTGDSAKINGTSIINTRYTMGDMAEQMKTLAVHSVIASRLRVIDQNNYIPASKTDIGFDTYMGFKLLITDHLPVLNDKYYSYMFADNVVKWGQGGALKPIESERYPKRGRGGGMEAVVVRMEGAYCPLGYSFTGTIANKTPTQAELQAAATWTRVYQRKNVPFAVLVSAG